MAKRTLYGESTTWDMNRLCDQPVNGSYMMTVCRFVALHRVVLVIGREIVTRDEADTDNVVVPLVRNHNMPRVKFVGEGPNHFRAALSEARRANAMFSLKRCHHVTDVLKIRVVVVCQPTDANAPVGPEDVPIFRVFSGRDFPRVGFQDSFLHRIITAVRGRNLQETTVTSGNG